MKRARVAVAVTVTGLAAVLGISLLTPSGGATPALPSRVSDNPVDYTPVISGNACLSDDVADASCRRVRDITRLGDSVYVGGIIDSVTDRTNGAVRTVGNAMMFNARTGQVSTSFHPKFTGATGALTDGQVLAVERSTGGSAVWFGGEFKQVDGVTNRGLIRWDVATNKQFTGFKPNIGSDGRTARVYDAKYFCGRLWVAGDFTQRRRRQPDRAGQPQPRHRRGHQRGQPAHRRHRERQLRPDPDHQDRAEPGLQARGAHRQLHPDRQPRPLPGRGRSTCRRPAAGRCWRRGTAPTCGPARPGSAAPAPAAAPR